jgi:hypothetical protein
MTDSVTIAGRVLRFPFRAAGLWVEDARGQNVCETTSLKFAEGLAFVLNQHPGFLKELNLVSQTNNVLRNQLNDTRRQLNSASWSISHALEIAGEKQ